jgi:hypothetical protein
MVVREREPTVRSNALAFSVASASFEGIVDHA